MASSAHYTCSKVLNALKGSQLDFFLQETPYSVYLTIRKKYVKNFKPASDNNHDANDKMIEDLTQENEKLRNVVSEMSLACEKNKKEVLILEKRLEKAEEDMFKQFEEEKKQKSKLTDEINLLKSIKKKDNDSISCLTKDLKSIQKTLTNTEKKNENLRDKADNLHVSKCDLEREKGKLLSEVKIMKKKVKHIEEQNNNNNKILENISSSSSICCSNTSSQTTKPFKCLICGKLCMDSIDLKKHSEVDHELSIDLEKLEDPNEEDSTSRFVNSMNVDPDYLLKRRNCFPDHWDHIDERNKIRMLAKMNFADKSARIDRNMKQFDFINFNYKGVCFETSML